jgi:hypothetical protein
MLGSLTHGAQHALAGGTACQTCGNGLANCAALDVNDALFLPSSHVLHHALLQKAWPAMYSVMAASHVFQSSQTAR